MHYSSIFISDTHLFNRGFKSQYLNEFLEHNSCDNLYLNGDILDIYCVDGKRAIWDESTTTIITRILTISRQGTNIFYSIGNHDEALEHFLPLDFGNIHIRQSFDHITRSGKRYLVIHGQQFDVCVGNMKWLSKLGAFVYDRLLSLNHTLHAFRVKVGMKKYWSLSKFLKKKAKQAVSFIQDFKLAAVKMARDRGYDGIIVGHIHQEDSCVIDGIHYVNSGDWVESISCAVEDENGDIKILRMHEITGFWEEK